MKIKDIKKPSIQTLQKLIVDNIRLRHKLFNLSSHDLKKEKQNIEIKFFAGSQSVKRTLLQSIQFKNMQMKYIIDHPDKFEIHSDAQDQELATVA